MVELRGELAFRGSRRGGAVLFLALTIWGCGDHEFEPPSEAERVAAADSAFTPALFDTVTWAADSVRALEGDLVYSTECRSCHGPLGRGGTAYARERGLDVPSLVRPDWDFGDDLVAVRREVFTGHPEGMPTWGVARITPRQIDAVAYYIVGVLRPEVLGRGGGGDPP